ncbi:MAG: hypothetical protein HY093_00845 [Candidatus Liptonbacteria bacterium]|nr:hypothetical protein [Candidatus Liptonbacteria bacterium]
MKSRVVSSPQSYLRYVPLDFRKDNSALHDGLVQRFELAYHRIEGFWNQELHIKPRILSPNHPIVPCFIWQWVTLHAPFTITKECSVEEIVSIVEPTAFIVGYFRCIWADRHGGLRPGDATLLELQN